MIETGIIVLCLLVNAFLAGAEMAFVAVGKPVFVNLNIPRSKLRGMFKFKMEGAPG